MPGFVKKDDAIEAFARYTQPVGTDLPGEKRMHEIAVTSAGTGEPLTLDEDADR